MSKIKGESFIEWKYVPTKENPADLESRGCEITTIDDKSEVSKWLQDQTQWSEQPKIKNWEAGNHIYTLGNMFDTLLIKILTYLAS